MILKPQDLLVVLKLLALEHKPWSYNKLALELGMSPAEVHAAIKRAMAARLALKLGDEIRPHVGNLEEFLLHGVQYVFVPERGEMTRGVATLHAAQPMSLHFVADGEPPPVWPDAEGEVRGTAFTPLYASVAKAARNDAALYELLVLVDAVRGGRARERDFAKKELGRRLARYDKAAKSES